MKENVRLIKYLWGLTIGSFFLTYLVSANMEYEWVSINQKWISNNFLFAVFGGTFTGLLVTLLMEYRHYSLNKNRAKNTCYMSILSLYAQLQIYYHNLIRAKNDNVIITDRLIDVEVINQNSQTIKNVEYVPIKKDDLELFISDFNIEYDNSITSLILDSNFLSQAILMDRIENIKKLGQEVNITYQSPYVKKVVDILLSKSSSLVEDVSGYAQRIAKICDREKDWERFKQTVILYEQSYKMTSLEEFLLKNKECGENV